jgi:uncharacterized protein (TIGR02453 family)
MPMSAPRFTPKTLTFLRALKRNNDKEWFREHKPQYDADVKAPMIALIEQLALDFPAFAPELVASPKGIFRIYRDTRFSHDKAPLKTNIAATFTWRGLAKFDGAGLYIEVSPTRVCVGGGMYAPASPQMAAIRAHIASSHKQFRAIVESPGFKKAVGSLEGEKLQRVPRGFAPDHPAAEYLKLKQFIVLREFPPTFACDPKFYKGVLGIYRQITPLIRFLNEPLIKNLTI